MHLFRFLSLFCVAGLLSVVGCGGRSDEATTMDIGEVQQYVNENAAALAEEDAIEAAEEAESAAEEAAEAAEDAE